MAKKSKTTRPSDIQNVRGDTPYGVEGPIDIGEINQFGVGPVVSPSGTLAGVLSPEELEHLTSEGNAIEANANAISTILSSNINGTLAKAGNVLNDLAGVQNGDLKAAIDAADNFTGDLAEVNNIHFANAMGGIQESLSPFPVPIPNIGQDASGVIVPNESFQGIRRGESGGQTSQQTTSKVESPTGQMQTGGGPRLRSPTTGFLVGKGGLIPRYNATGEESNVRKSRATKAQNKRSDNNASDASNAEQIQSAKTEEKQTIQRTQSALNSVASQIPWKALGFASEPTSDIGQLAAHFQNLGHQLNNIVQAGGSNDTHFIDPLTGEVKPIGSVSTMEALINANRIKGDKDWLPDGTVVAEDEYCIWKLSNGTPYCHPKGVLPDAMRSDAVPPFPVPQQIATQQPQPIFNAQNQVVGYTCPPCKQTVCPPKACKYDIRNNSPDKAACNDENRPNIATDWRAYQSSRTVIRNSSSEGPEDNSAATGSRSVYLSSPGQPALSPLDSLLAADSDQDCVQSAVDDMGLSNKPKESESTNPALQKPIADLQTVTICDAVLKVESFIQGDFKTGIRDGLRRFFKIDTPGTPIYTDFVSRAIGEVTDGIATVVSDGIANAFGFVQDQIVKTNCNPIAISQGAVALSVMGFMEQWLGADLSVITKPIRQGMNFFCPQDLPSPDNAIEAMLSNKIDRSLYECWVKAGGQSLSNWDRLLDARRSKFSLLDYTMLFKRGTISQSDLNAIARELGFVKDYDVSHSLELFHQLPPISDIIRFMVRDADDRDTVERFGLDHGFTDKYQDQLRQWGEWQGIDEKTALYNWRSHWSIPSPTQLYEIYHRLRKPGIDRTNDPLFDDVKQALIQQDILPFWIDKLVDVSFKPLNRTDLVRAVDVGVVNKPQALKAFVELGYTDEVAQTLSEATFAQLRRKFIRNRYVRAYGNNLISRETARQALRDFTVPPEIIEFILDSSRADREAKLKTVCLRNYKRRFKLGEFREDDLRQNLNNLGLDPDQVENEIAAMKCELSSRDKHVSIATLCKWLELGIINGFDFTDRAMKLGFDPVDAFKFLQSCQSGINAKQRKQIQQQIKQQAASELRQQREAEKTAAKQTRATDKQRAALEKARKIKDRRIDLEFGAAEAWKKASGKDIGPALREVQDATNRVAATLDGDWDAAIRAVTLAAETADKPTESPLMELVGPILAA